MSRQNRSEMPTVVPFAYYYGNEQFEYAGPTLFNKLTSLTQEKPLRMEMTSPTSPNRKTLPTPESTPLTSPVRESRSPFGSQNLPFNETLANAEAAASRAARVRQSTKAVPPQKPFPSGMPPPPPLPGGSMAPSSPGPNARQLPRMSSRSNLNQASPQAMSASAATRATSPAGVLLSPKAQMRASSPMNTFLSPMSPSGPPSPSASPLVSPSMSPSPSPLQSPPRTFTQLPPPRVPSRSNLRAQRATLAAGPPSAPSQTVTQPPKPLSTMTGPPSHANAPKHHQRVHIRPACYSPPDIDSIEQELRLRVYGGCPVCNLPRDDYKKCYMCFRRQLVADFVNWSTGIDALDTFIRETHIEVKNDVTYQRYFEWIPFEHFANVRTIGQGGSGAVYSAQWRTGPRLELRWKREHHVYVFDRFENFPVALKTLGNSENVSEQFISQLRGNYHTAVTSSTPLIHIYGLTCNPETNELMMITQFAEGGDLHSFLTRYPAFSWHYRLGLLHAVAKELECIHQSGFVHRNLHPGNILIKSSNSTITTHAGDIGLVPLADAAARRSGTSGVIPYLAPEVLRGNPHSPAADVYSFGIIMVEMLTHRRPFANRAHDYELVVDICNGVRPAIPSSMNVPESYLGLINRCLQPDPALRATARELKDITYAWILNPEELSSEFDHVPQVMTEEEAPQHPKAVYTSRFIPSVDPEADSRSRSKRKQLHTMVVGKKLNAGGSSMENLRKHLNATSKSPTPTAQGNTRKHVNVSDNDSFRSTTPKLQKQYLNVGDNSTFRSASPGMTEHSNKQPQSSNSSRPATPMMEFIRKQLSKDSITAVF